MKRDLPAYVVRLKGVLYFKRRGWKTYRFQNQILNDGFWAEYARTLNGVEIKPTVFLVRDLIARYYDSPKFKNLADRSRKDYIKYLDVFGKNAGAVGVSSIKRKNIIAWRDQLAVKHTPHFANYWLRVVRPLFEFAIDLDALSSNPAKGIPSLKYQKREAKPWPLELIQKAREARPSGDRTRLLFELLYCTGQRIGDVLDAEWTDIQGSRISVRQNKTGTPLVLPITEELAKCLREAKRYNEVPTILANYQGKGKWSYRGAHDAVMKLRKEIGAQDHAIHDIRHTVASEIVAAGGGDEEGMAITGHKTPKMFAHYSKATRQITRAENAQKRRGQNKNKT
ncbi:tyrosine-type recombinase/integrase [Aestuariibius sp. HNIBRBA575]|uniref:tyrosine-type recombinase/integrase n=1 Tax=Aestuariibius sp. HNIBRBA575 TaxID=3233343 RepID=UPI0034A281C2